MANHSFLNTTYLTLCMCKQQPLQHILTHRHTTRTSLCKVNRQQLTCHHWAESPIPQPSWFHAPSPASRSRWKHAGLAGMACISAAELILVSGKDPVTWVRLSYLLRMIIIYNFQCAKSCPERSVWVHTHTQAHMGVRPTQTSTLHTIYKQLKQIMNMSL